MRLKHKCKRQTERSTQQRIRNILKYIINIHIKREVKGSGCKSESLGFLASWSWERSVLCSWLCADVCADLPDAQLHRIDLLQLLQQSCGGNTRLRAGTQSLYFCEEERRKPTDRWWSRPSPSAAPCASPPGCPAVRQSCFSVLGKVTFKRNALQYCVTP